MKSYFTVDIPLRENPDQIRKEKYISRDDNNCRFFLGILGRGGLELIYLRN